jgi:hypothetical protein
MTKEVSPGGSVIHRYAQAPPEGPLVHGDGQQIETISNHIERWIGPVKTVFHELVSQTVHVDIHWVEATGSRPFHTLVTSGMSELPMAAPEGLEDLARAELVTLLPSEWPLTQEAFQDERNYWPIRQMKILARFPHNFRTWLGVGHTIPNGDPPEPYAPGVGFTGAILLPPWTLPDGFHSLDVDGVGRIHFLGVIPLFPDEMDLKLREGSDALFGRFEKWNLSPVIDVGRSTTVRKRWWLFG